VTRRSAIAGVLVVVALVIRVGEVERTSYRPLNDGASYLTLASEIAHGGDYSSHDRGAGDSGGPSAYFPPAYPYFLAAVDVLDGDRGVRGNVVEPARIANAVLGTVTVALVGLVAYEALGETIGLIALGLAAIYPAFIELSGVLVAENLLTALVLAAVYAALRARRAEHPWAWIAAAGVLTGLATLTHENGVVLVIPLAIAAWSATNGSVAAPAVLVAAGVLVLVPWTIRDAVELHRFVPVSDEAGITLAGTYNAASAADPRIPYQWRLYLPERHRSRLAEPALSNDQLHDALRYIGNHPFAPVAVAYHNVRRLLELEGSFAWEVSTASIGLPRGTAEIGVIGFWILCLLAIAGAFTKPVRRAPRWMWLVPVLFALSIVLVNAETPRFREPVDAFLLLSAACAVAAGARLLGRAPIRRVRRAPLPARGAQLVEVRERLA
jgi:4-amino-4-deoxy-L-arabinose transferase-like glycosyltransferase